jgi:hypothetical protein
VPPDSRDEEWRRGFYAAVTTASLTPGTPDSFAGPDGFRYASLCLPPIGESFAAWSIALLAEWCTENGCGVAVHDREGATAWVFTYGNLWSLRSLGTLDASPPGDRQQVEVLAEEEQVLVASPSDDVLPPWARVVLRGHLETAGVVAPRVALVARPGRVPEHSLAVTLPADRAIAHRLTWVLPPHVGLLDIADLGHDSGRPL